jgi:SAM-dependent methyltransferase
LRDAVRRSPALTRFLVRVAGRAQALRDRGLTRSGRWRRRAGDETRYWEDALTADDAREAFSERLDPEAPLEDDSLIRAVDEVDAEVVEILDVGSGPLTSVGKTHRDRRLKIVAVDPLADDYARILREAGIDAPVVPVACGGEEIAEHLGEDSFDVAYALNALDHCADPMLVLDNMRRVVRPGGRIALTHMRNEGERNGYFGIHFWNLDCQDGRFVVWNRDERHDVAAELGDVEIDCWLGAGWVSCLIRPQA